jgi:predicted DNA-binding protein (MmcQ/YjbR family)
VRKHAIVPAVTLERLRRFCLSLPGTSEKSSWGHPNFCVADKIFASYGAYGGRTCVGFKAAKEEQAELVRDARYAVAPYVGKHGWVCQWIELPFAWSDLEAHVLASYRRIAPKTLLRDLDAAASGHATTPAVVPRRSRVPKRSRASRARPPAR